MSILFQIQIDILMRNQTKMYTGLFEVDYINKVKVIQRKHLNHIFLSLHHYQLLGSYFWRTFPF